MQLKRGQGISMEIADYMNPATIHVSAPCKPRSGWSKTTAVMNRYLYRKNLSRQTRTKRQLNDSLGTTLLRPQSTRTFKPRESIEYLNQGIRSSQEAHPCRNLRAIPLGLAGATATFPKGASRSFLHHNYHSNLASMSVRLMHRPNNVFLSR